MNRRVLLLLLAVAALTVSPLLALPELTEEELNANRAQVAKAHEQPERLARLRGDLCAFLALPTDRREQILKFDADLQEQPAANQAKLVNVLERYVSWLERLPASDRQEIEKIGNMAARLAMIQDLRDREWIKAQPAAVQKQFAGLKAMERQEFTHNLRQAEQKRHADWQLAARFWNRLNDGKAPPPLQFTHLSTVDQEGVRDYLMMFLSPEEKQRLQAAEGLWPNYVITLVELADKHPFALPGPNGPSRIDDLPKALRNRFDMKEHDLAPITVLEKLRMETKGKFWPAMGEAAARLNRRLLWIQNGPLPRELWACNKESLLRPMQVYLDVLQNSVKDSEWATIVKATNKWPDYPLAIQKLAEKHKLPAPPWQTALSGPREQWDDFRPPRAADQRLQVPQHVLEEFVMFKLKPEERARLHFSPLDPQSWKRVEARYQEHVHEMNKFLINTKKFGNGHFTTPSRDRERDRKGHRD